MNKNFLFALRFSNIYFTFALMLFVISLTYGILQFRTYQLERTAIKANETDLREKSREFDAYKTQYEMLAQDQEKEQEDMLGKISTILPPDEKYTDLTRQLERYFADNDRPGNQIIQSNLIFSRGAPVPDAGDVSALPFTMHVEATRDNFFRFLDYVKSSGSLDTGARLMDITSIDLNFPSEGELIRDTRQKINFTVYMNAYYHTPKIERPR